MGWTRMNVRLSFMEPIAVLGLSGCFGSSTAAPITDAGIPAEAATSSDGATMPGARAPGIYVSLTNNGVLVFAPDATGNVAPVRTIAGAHTGLAVPIGLALDPAGNLYVANRMGAGVTVYAPGATGDVAPIRTLSATGLQAAQALAVGPSGDVFVANCPACDGPGGPEVAVVHFPAGATQSDYSLAGQNTGFTNPGGIALDSRQELIVGNSFGGTIATFAPGAMGNAMPIRSFTPTPTTPMHAIAVADDTLFVSTSLGSLSLFPASATGNAMASSTFVSLSVQYPAGVAIDTSAAQPVVYLVDTTAGVIHIIQTSGSAPMFAPGPATTIQGTATGLQSPLAIAVVR
jgi:hypothetical protein